MILGLLLVAYENVDNSITSVASSVGGSGVLAALVLAFIALVMVHHAGEKADELAKKVEGLQDKLEEVANEEEEEDW